MSFRRGRQYKHVHNTDVCIEVKSAFFIPEKQEWKVTFWWLNCVNPANLFMICTDWARIPRSQVKNWLPYQ